jgi:hypothetical protein
LTIQARGGVLVTAHGVEVQKNRAGVPGNASVSMAGPDRAWSMIEVSSTRVGRRQPPPSCPSPSQYALARVNV